MRIGLLLLCSVLVCVKASAQDEGRQVFVSRCAGCHGSDGNGGELGPGIATRVPLRSDQDLSALLRQGLPAAGMPAFGNLTESESGDLVRFLRSLTPRAGSGPERAKVTLVGGRSLEGLVLNRSSLDLQLLDDDQTLHLLRKRGEQYRAVTSQADWPTYNGQTNGSRYSPLAQINKDNAARLTPKWIFSLANTSPLQVTPVVAGGVMYVTSANECYALDAGTGREIWHYQRPRTKGLIGNAAGGVNRGVAVAGDRVFMVTDHAHLIALDRAHGRSAWDTEMADWHQNYNATGAPLPVGNLVVTGTSGGDEGVRGFVAAFDQSSGKEVWRFWTVPKRGEPGSETWQGKGIEHPGGTTWMTGAYDAALDTLYWSVGNPGPDLIGDDRLGDNLYTDSVVALDAEDRQAEVALPVHAARRLGLRRAGDPGARGHRVAGPAAQADRAGQSQRVLLRARSHRRKVPVRQAVREERDVGVRADGRRPADRRAEHGADARGHGACARRSTARRTGIRRRSTRSTNLYYVQTNDKCGIFTKTPMDWEAGKGFMGGSFKPAPEPAQRILRAIDIQTGKAVWELPQTGAVNSWGGALSTAGGVVIFGEDSGALMAADASTGKPLWSFQTSQLWKASPMTYMFDNAQYVAVAAGSNIIAFGLP